MNISFNKAMQYAEYNPEGLVHMLQPKRRFQMIVIITSALILMYGLFCVVLPVLITGNYNAVWPHTERTYKNVVGFYLFLGILFTSPFYIPAFKTGAWYFYNDRVVLKTLLGQNIITVKYKQMYALHIRTSIVITRENVPSWANPIQRYKIMYWKGLFMPLSQIAYANPSDAAKALELIKQNALAFIEQKTIL
ncbi:MAG: hypothetical protein JXR79_00370 [Nitrospirae bacterium]|nr:hypothetical protein [Nitrospirota bacterium]